MTIINNDLVYSDNITHLIDFNMHSSVSNSGTVENTTYHIYGPTDPNPDYDSAFVGHSGINTNVVIKNNEFVSSDSISSDDLEGQATISGNNGIYNITFSFSNSQNEITGAYVGGLTVINDQ